MQPSVFTYNTLIRGLCRIDATTAADEEPEYLDPEKDLDLETRMDLELAAATPRPGFANLKTPSTPAFDVQRVKNTRKDGGGSPGAAEESMVGEQINIDNRSGMVEREDLSDVDGSALEQKDPETRRRKLKDQDLQLDLDYSNTSSNSDLNPDSYSAWSDPDYVSANPPGILPTADSGDRRSDKAATRDRLNRSVLPEGIQEALKVKPFCAVL